MDEIGDSTVRGSLLPVSERVRRRLLAIGPVRRAWGLRRAAQLQASYVRRREQYQARASSGGLRYDERLLSERTAARLAKRGYSPIVRDVGDVHSFAFIPRFGWHCALYADLAALGPVTEFDYVGRGYDITAFYRGDTVSRERMNREFIESACRAHSHRSIDWIFVYASGVELLANSLHRLQEQIGVPIVTMCLDDKQSWAGRVIGDQHEGMLDLAKWTDLAWTSASIATEWYLAEGGNPLYMPEGFDQSVYRPLPLQRDIPVSFIGDAYGFRRSFVDYLRQHGIPVSVFGGGWNTKRVWGDEQVSIINRSRINLGHGGIGYSEELTNVKTRDFEIPGTGGGVYITTFNPDLARHFAINTEIVCYRSREEAVELISYFSAHPEEANRIAAAARCRCIREHRWLHRYRRILEVLAILEPVHQS